ncbi:ABC transporter ATP-binding protein [Arthrobacter sulfonylureivorans]|uniref:ABC transporter ATP-binding protein n=1 Tax=Arthrobacter sulfonylureivorans TaxID=2486855 RepID=A0ABY3W6M7_9MICC|nr:ABC transporter ATP-binding protein [Arthrobacter sulfonylureivorans]UNK45651.1 ABC transporter ATP-binding protein [Arthrobacter sulfonylureivorans]
MHIDISSLSKAFNGNPILKDINMSISSGEFITLLGPSGCGKTTTLRCVAGLETPDQGSIKVEGKTFVQAQNKTFLPTHKRQVGMVFQSYALWPHMSVSANVAYPLKRQKTPQAELKQRVATTLEAVGMGQHANRYPHELSGGQQQRVALARGLVSARGVMLFDEPLSNLDAKLRIAMRSEIRRLHDKFGNTSIYVTHDQDEALALSDRVIIMNGGVVEQMGTPAEVHTRPVSSFAADFVGFENILQCQAVSEETGRPVASLQGGLRLPLGAATASLAPGKFVAFRSSNVIICDPQETGIDGSGTVRDSSYTGESRTVIVDIADGTGLTVAVPDTVDAVTTYRHGGTEVRFHVPEPSLVVLDR